jgi:hypothetical protein
LPVILLKPDIPGTSMWVCSKPDDEKSAKKGVIKKRKKVFWERQMDPMLKKGTRILYNLIMRCNHFPAIHEKQR